MDIFAILYRTMVNGKLVVNPFPISARVKELAPHLGRVGFDRVLLPPVTMSQSVAADNADGYGVQYHLNVGQFKHPTRLGTAIQTKEAVDECHKEGLYVDEDAVVHQMDGGNKQTYIELGHDGKPDPTLFPKYPSCFAPTAPVDDVFDPEGNSWFGDLIVYLRSLPKNYMLNGIIQSILWRKQVFGFDGGRLDDTKGENVTVTKKIFTAVGGWWFGECFVGYEPELARWSVQNGGRRTLDFPFHWTLQRLSNGASFKILLEPYSSLWRHYPDYAVLFADSADTDNNNGQNIKWNKRRCYVLIMLVPAAGTLTYGGDYLPERYNLMDTIDNLLYIKNKFAYGSIKYERVEDTFVAFSRNGDGGDYGKSKGLFVAINSDPINYRSEWVHTSFPPHTHLHNYANTEGDDLWTNQDCWIYVTVAPNKNGEDRGYVCYAEAGIHDPIKRSPINNHGTGEFTNFSSITVKYKL